MKKVLLSSALIIAVLTGCGEEKKSETKAVVETQVEQKTPEQKLVEQVKESSSIVASTMKEAGSEVAQKIVEESKELAKVGSEAAKSVSEKVAVKTEEITKEVVETASETKDKIEESINSIVATKNDSTSSAEGKALYLKCAGCHGQSAEKAALGKSQVVKGWDAQKIETALLGYKAGTYGGVMKGVMKSQVANMSDEDIKALSAYMASF